MRFPRNSTKIWKIKPIGIQPSYARATEIMSTQSSTGFEWSIRVMNSYICAGIASQFKPEGKFIFNYDQDSNNKKITKSIEIVYGLRNFIGNANKFCKSKIFISLKSNSDFTMVAIEDDGDGYPSDILSKIGEPYLRSTKALNKEKKGLGLGLFIGKTLLEKNFASVNCSNSETRSGAEVVIKWNNKDLFNL